MLVHTQPGRAISKDGDQANHETNVRGIPSEPGGGWMCPVAVDSCKAGSKRSRAGLDQAGALADRDGQPGDGQPGGCPLALKDPDDPRWSGRAPAASTASRAGTVMASPGQPQPKRGPDRWRCARGGPSKRTGGARPARHVRAGWVADRRNAGDGRLGPGGCLECADCSRPRGGLRSAFAAGRPAPAGSRRRLRARLHEATCRKQAWGCPPPGRFQCRLSSRQAVRRVCPRVVRRMRPRYTPASVTPATPAAVAPGQATQAGSRSLAGAGP